ncbi:MAG: hypothetical protein DI616_08760 [Paracoccus denitrificans]|uniref:Uncharacterized protein n=1 Tax=Paracoccus denitrificans TaxID=266 RepID=A0A533I6K2_PARDE|nr:MAG: hypothetical protein DI616_08760 [Paracoccus denitrificans]
MLFDVQAALAEVLADKPANPDNPDKQTPQLADLADLAEGLAAISTPASAPAPSPSRQAYPPGAIVHLSRHRPKLDGDGRPVRVLPTHPATCVICGVADWLVGMTDMQGRTLHVRCWKVERGTS